jgi:hypothetical protein
MEDAYSFLKHKNAYIHPTKTNTYSTKGGKSQLLISHLDGKFIKNEASRLYNYYYGNTQGGVSNLELRLQTYISIL